MLVVRWFARSGVLLLVAARFAGVIAVDGLWHAVLLLDALAVELAGRFLGATIVVAHWLTLESFVGLVCLRLSVVALRFGVKLISDVWSFVSGAPGVVDAGLSQTIVVLVCCVVKAIAHVASGLVRRVLLVGGSLGG